MQISRKKTVISIFVLFALLTITAPLIISPNTSAHTPGWNVPTFAYLAVSPDPYGLGSAQPLLIVFWLNVPPPTAAGTTGDRWRGMTVDVTTPSGTCRTLRSNHFRRNWLKLICSTLQPKQETTAAFFNFPGQNLSRTGPTGLTGPDNVYVGDYFMPSNTTHIIHRQRYPNIVLPRSTTTNQLLGTTH